MSNANNEMFKMRLSIGKLYTKAPEATTNFCEKWSKAMEEKQKTKNRTW